MVIQLPTRTGGLERTVRFVRHTLTNMVACIQNSAMLEEEAAWEVMLEGALDAFAARLAQENDGVHKAFQLGDELAERVRRQQIASLPA